MNDIDALLAKLARLPASEKAAIAQHYVDEARNLRWVPNPDEGER